MNKEKKTKQIVIRFDMYSYDKIKECAQIEHRGLGELVRHATLEYIEQFPAAQPALHERKLS